MKREEYRRGRHRGRIEVGESGRMCQLLRYVIRRLAVRVADLSSMASLFGHPSFRCGNKLSHS